MLRGLDIRDMLIIDRLEMQFRPGLNVLTGETGAGKSILLDALGFVLGWRGRADLVRTGAERGEVVAVFELSADHPARLVLQEAGFEVGDELVLRRVNSADGRKSAWVNDSRASGEVLRQLSVTLVELHGQHDDRGLLNSRGHRQLLDAFGALDAERAATRTAWRARARADRELAAARTALEAAQAEEDFLRHAVAELETLAPQPGEEAELDARRRLMQASVRVREDISRAHAALSPDGAEGMLMDATRWLEDAAGSVEGRLDPALAALEQAMTGLGEAQQAVESCIEALDFDPSALEAVEERLFALRGLARKHGVLPEDLTGLSAELRARLDRIEGGADHLAGLEAAANEAEVAYNQAAQALSAARRAAALRLDAAMAQELAPLKLAQAAFSTAISDGEPGPDGSDSVAFEVATNPGAPPGPLNKIASGGELSRFLLALKVCLSIKAGGPHTLIFDEIDRGVGGATADAVGRRLAALAERAQVLVVTHSPQVAARGAHHWRVAKHVRDGQTFSQVASLDAGDRVDEIARMLAGDTVTDAARAAARALLQQ